MTLLVQEKHKTVLQKTHQKSIRRATVRGESQPDELSQRNTSEFKALVTEQQTKVQYMTFVTCSLKDPNSIQVCAAVYSVVCFVQLEALRKENQTALAQLHRDQLQLEFDFRMKSLAQFAETLHQLADASSQSCQKKYEAKVMPSAASIRNIGPVFRLNEIHEREVSDLLKKLATEKKLEAQTLKQKAGNKSEYDR